MSCSEIKRCIASLIAAFLLVFSAFASASCGSDAGANDSYNSTDIPADTEGAETEAETTSDTDARKQNDDGLPQKDFGGYNFRIVFEKDQEHFYYTDNLTGDVINDAVYERNLAVSEKYNVEFSKVHCEDYQSNGDWIQKTILAGEDAFDMSCTHVVYTGLIAQKGIFMNYYDLPYINFAQPWWSRSNIEDLTYNGVALLAIGDYALSAIGRTYCVFFNKVQAESYGMPNMYQLVQDGKWTIDKLSDLTKDIYTDLNSNQQKDEEDYYGFATGWASDMTAYLWAFDNPVCRKDSSGEIQVVLHTDKINSIVEKLNKLMWENPGTYYTQKNTDTVHSEKGGRDLFRLGRTLFGNGYIDYSIEFFREIDDDYGIIPYPKWDEAQAEYRSLVNGNHPILGVPMTTQDPERTGIIIEALNSESYRSLIPVYIETALKVKYARDNESVQVLDMLIANRFFDFGYVYDGWKGGSFWIQNLIAAKQTEFESFYAKNETMILKHYSDVLEVFRSYSE
ncbi:MAG: hypothetical protein GX827_05125 [Clostridiales bacterium]|nr:hypothetical protein [Clostridiales bacterium]